VIQTAKPSKSKALLESTCETTQELQTNEYSGDRVEELGYGQCNLML